MTRTYVVKNLSDGEIAAVLGENELKVAHKLATALSRTDKAMALVLARRADRWVVEDLEQEEKHDRSTNQNAQQSNQVE